MIFFIILVFLAFFYATVSLSLIIGILRLKKHTQVTADQPFVSILVPAKNEEQNIIRCLESLLNQQYPHDRYEIIAINDRSTDKTQAIIENYMGKHGIVKCVNLNSNPSDLTGKQNALKEGLKSSKGEIILNIDADCVAGELWVKRMVSYFTSNVGFLIGFTTAYDPVRPSVFTELQALDMLFLMESAAGSIGMNIPVSCMGSNLAYRRKVIENLREHELGYTITEDTTLIQKIAKHTNWKITVAYDKDAVVSTLGEKSFGNFLSQRIRWILGGQASKLWTLFPLYAIFLFNFCIAIALPFTFFAWKFAFLVFLSILIKSLFDFIRCWHVCGEFGRYRLLKLFPLYECFMILYSVITGFGSAFVRKVRWKGEVYTRGAVANEAQSGG